MENPYAILGLSSSAPEEEITRTYRKLVHRYPPELAPQQFARIHRAWQLLTSLEHRMLAVRDAPVEAIDQAIALPDSPLAPPPPPPSLTAGDLEPLAGPIRRALLVEVLRSSFDG